MIKRLLAPVAEIREEESTTVVLMFAYSLLAMTAYNILKPITRSKFITDLGADNLPYVLIGAAVMIGFLMAGYSRLMAVMPKRWGLPIVQLALAGILVGFWFLFQTGAEWASVAFYFLGLLLGILLISQFWTLANVVYDARQAKRIFGFIGGGAPLGGILGSFILTQYARTIGTTNLLILSAATLAVAALVAAIIIGREHKQAVDLASDEENVSSGEALRLLRNSRHLQIIAMVISFAAIGAAIIEQQLNMAAEGANTRSATDAITVFLGKVQLWTSAIGFIIQVSLTSRIHRFLGIGFALLLLPVGLGTSALVMLFNRSLWAPGFARVLDQSMRYTVDKTTREILFLPLPSDVKYQAKPFVDVTVDRFAKGISAALLLVLIKPWGFELDWQRLSYASLAVTALWIVMALRAKREYLASFRRSIERRELETVAQPLVAADLTTIETLVEELAHPDERRVLYAIDVLESLDKRNLVTPLLLRHDSPAVRARALGAIGRLAPEAARRWRTSIERLLTDTDPDVRAAAVGALAAVRGEQAADLVRPFLTDTNPRLVVTAATTLANSAVAADARAAEAALSAVIADTRPDAARARRDVAAALRGIANPDFRHLLIPLLYDSDPSVAEEAMRSVGAMGSSEFIFLPTLVALLRNRRLKAAARDVLVAYGPDALEPLAHFLADPEEDPWVRRHLPAAIARIGTPRAVEILVKTLDDPAGFVRYKAIQALERLRQEHVDLQFPREPVERLLIREARHYFAAITAHDHLFGPRRPAAPEDTPLIASALEEKSQRTLDRMYRLLSLLYSWKDVDAVRWALERGDARAKSSASEYLDNVLTGAVRRTVMPALEPLPRDEKLRRGYVILRSRPRSTEETLLELINDEDQVIAACAIDYVRISKEWSLTDDIEHVLAHRDVRDWYVFESASWTLAAHRLGDARRQELWLEPLPASELASRWRRLPLFASVWIDELFRMVSAGRQVRWEPGRTLMQEGSAPDAVHVLLEGEVVPRRHGAPGRPLKAPAAIGLRETLEGHPARATVRTERAVVTLALPPEDVRALVADNQDLLDGLLRTIVGSELLGSQERAVVKGGAPPDLLALAADGVAGIEKVLMLQRLPLFAAVSADEMLHVAAIAREVKVEAGQDLASAGQAPAIYFVLTGELSTELAPSDPAVAAEPRAVGPGDALGLFETLAGRAIGRRITATRSGVVLKIDRRDLIDQLGQRPVLVQQVFASLFEMLEHAVPAQS
jgi:ATP/ADP translocase/HEAT repeat protein/CRP-like cAMP-binding protein